MSVYFGIERCVWWSEDNLICDSDIWENEGLKFEKKCWYEERR